ncbi:hypothetical protein [Cellulomonas sp. KH9]|uniref:DUF7144 family membrane protein n=1 Tax=Cellulomonas sp. KH9 TaxID=1855324 RepID=UPI0008EE39CE|nr:hypothetical protein [Cellulomonas sp. KH9]SFJ98659.1 hypothetical protein SAMN05216467_1557 [Cellulomonas sp. KH9]
MSEQTRSREAAPATPNAFARGTTVLAAVLMIVVGSFNVIQGLVAVFQDDFYVATPNYLLQLDVGTWGWVHLLVGLLVVLAGFAVLSGRVWARAVGVALAVVSAVANFAFIPYYPFWSLTIIAVDIVVIWALTAHGRDITMP